MMFGCLMWVWVTVGVLLIVLLIDPVVSLLIRAVIVWGTWDLLRESVNLALQGVPKDLDLDAVQRYLSALLGIAKVHDPHI
jgi:cobalt-zinc-cadmium efflux system protein